MTRLVKYTNNAAGKIRFAISASTGLIDMLPADADKFPAPATLGTNLGWFYATLFDANGNIEIIRINGGTDYRPAQQNVLFNAQRGVDGTVARSWPANTDIQLRITRAMLNEIGPPADVQHFVTLGSSTWIKPTGAKMIYVQLWGPGGGGGSGRRRAVASQATAAQGGNGGSGGGYKEFWLPASSLNATETVGVSSGGDGGASRTADNLNGNSGQAGGAATSTHFKYYCTVGSGPGGPGGGTTGGSPTTTTSDSMVKYGTGEGRGGAGKTESGSTQFPTSAWYGGGGGGGGGGFAANSTTGMSGVWGDPGAQIFSTLPSENAGGTSGNAGSRAFSVNSVPEPENYLIVGGGGGGGGSTTTFTSGAASSPGQNGGKGGWPGGGGGGGAASQGSNSGAGGNGGDGYVRVTTFF